VCTKKLVADNEILQTKVVDTRVIRPHSNVAPTVPTTHLEYRSSGSQEIRSMTVSSLNSFLAHLI
jgi:hypothetical protein